MRGTDGQVARGDEGRGAVTGVVADGLGRHAAGAAAVRAEGAGLPSVRTSPATCPSSTGTGPACCAPERFRCRTSPGSTRRRRPSRSSPPPCCPSWSTRRPSSSRVCHGRRGPRAAVGTRAGGGAVAARGVGVGGACVLLGPTVYARYDVMVTAVAVAALLAAGRHPRLAGALGGPRGAAEGMWPALVLVGMRGRAPWIAAAVSGGRAGRAVRRVDARGVRVPDVPARARGGGGVAGFAGLPRRPALRLGGRGAAELRLDGVPGPARGHGGHGRAGAERGGARLAAAAAWLRALHDGPAVRGSAHGGGRVSPRWRC